MERLTGTGKFNTITNPSSHENIQHFLSIYTCLFPKKKVQFYLVFYGRVPKNLWKGKKEEEIMEIIKWKKKTREKFSSVNINGRKRKRIASG